MNWQLEQKKLAYRTRRTPSQSVLYQICFNLSQEFENNFEEKYQAQYGYYRKSITEALDKYLNCGILKHGCARAVCENCEHEELIAFSCKQRGLCPSCESKRAHIFAEHLNKNVLLAHPKVHVVFTIPKRLRIYFKYQRELLKKLYKAANLAWQAQIEEEYPDSETGAVMALHTAGELLNWHPHIHAVCLLGGIEQRGFRQLSYIDLKYLNRCFRDQVLEFLLKAELIDELVAENLKAQEHSGFNVWAGETIHSDQEELILYISRYLKKSTVNLTRLELINKRGEQYVRIKSKTSANLAEHRELKALDFLAEVTQHIPNKWE